MQRPAGERGMRQIVFLFMGGGRVRFGRYVRGSLQTIMPARLMKFSRRDGRGKNQPE